MAGLFAIFWNRPELDAARCHLHKLDFSRADGGLLFLVLTMSLLAFVSSAYLVGFLFGALAHIVELLWPRRSPEDLHEVLSSFGASRGQEEQIKAAFKEQFQFDLEEAGDGSTVTPSRQLTENSALCSYYVWANAPNLGTMTSRWDAETLASRSVFAASLVLTLLRLSQMVARCWRHSAVGSYAPVAIFISVGVTAFLQYKFQRRKQIQGRFSLFQALRATLRSETLGRLDDKREDTE